MPDKVHQICAVFPVMNGERGIKPDLVGIDAQESRAYSVKGPGPGQSILYGPRPVVLDLARDPLHPPGHFVGGSSRKSHEKDAAGISAVHDQMGDVMSQG